MRYKKCLFLALCLLPVAFVAAQNKDAAFFKKLDSLRSLAAHADTLSWQMLLDDTTELNQQIEKHLVSVLSDPAIRHHDPDSLLKDMVDIVHSKDRKLWIFSWYENTGGSFQSYLSVVHYRTADGAPRALPGYSSTGNAGDFPSYGGTFSHIYKLPAAGRQLYLCIGWVKGCNSCCGDIATVVELTKTGISFSYPAFPPDEETTEVSSMDERRETGSSFSSMLLDSRCGSVEKFEYDPATRTISYSYSPDDNTPVKYGEASKVSGALRWNGKYFVETLETE